MCGLLRRVFLCPLQQSNNVSLVRPHFVWYPYLLADIRTLELVWIRATKVTINDTFVDYKSQLIQLELLLLMMEISTAALFSFAFAY